MSNAKVFARTVAAIVVATCIGGSATARAQDQPAKADPAAYAMLKAAHDSRDVFAAGFPGVAATVFINDNGQQARGTLTYSATGDLTLDLGGASKQQVDWAREEIGSAFGHRRAGDFAKGDGRNALAFAPDDHSPLGRQILLNDRFNSAIRVKDGRITEVTRTMGPQRFTITVLNNKIADGGKCLPDQFVVTYFDAATGTIKQMGAYSDEFARVANAWVPSARRIVTAENGAFSTRTFALSDIRPLASTSTAKR